MKKDTLIAAFARANIFHVGHFLLIDKVKQLAAKYDADPAVFLSHSYDKKNPLPYNDKVKYMAKWTKGIVKIDLENKVKQPMNILHYANEHGYKNVYLVCGDDRLADYKKTFVDFSKSRDYFNFDHVDVLSRGSRDPDSDDGDGSSMSGTAMRGFVSAGDYESFRKALPKEANDVEAKTIWKLAMVGMKIKEKTIVESTDKLKVAKLIGTSLGVKVDSMTDPTMIINKGLKLIKSGDINKSMLSVISNMLETAKKYEIEYDVNLVPKSLKEEIEEFDDEDDEDISEYDDMIDAIDSFEDIIDLYDDEELHVVDHETDEYISSFIDLPDEEYELDESSLILEVLSRMERIKSRLRFARTAGQRQRKLKIALRTHSSSDRLHHRARTMAVRLMKTRLARKPLASLSMQEKERIERLIAKRSKSIAKMAIKLAPKIKQIEKTRIAGARKKMHEDVMSDIDMQQRHYFMKKLKDKKEEFIKRYGDSGETIMYAIATKQALNKTDN